MDKMTDILRLKAKQGTPEVDEIARLIVDKECIPDAVVRCDCGTSYLSNETLLMCPECKS